MITKEDIINAYKYILGRDPENEKVIEYYLNISDVSELRKIFLNSSEFYSKWTQIANCNIEKYILSGIRPPMSIDLNLSDEANKAIFEHIKKVWEALGVSEPHWSVMTHEKFKKENIDKNSEEFFMSGKQGVDLFISALTRNNINTQSYKTCLEFGCGIGRVTKHLANKFEKIYAYDISKNHLDLAKKYFEEFEIKNTDFIQLKELNELENIKEIDVVFSVIVLQHNPPPIICFILQKLMKALKAGGVAYFQVPTYKLGYIYSVKNYLNSAINETNMEMHVLPQKEIIKIAQKEGCQLIEVHEDNWIGRDNTGLSNTFLFIKN